MNNEVRKETNLEHYKEELKEIVSYHYERPSVMTTEIKNRLDKNIVSGLGPGGERFTDVSLNWMAQPYKGQVLDKVEKTYLSAIIKPFKANVTDICKLNGDRGFCYIRIYAESLSSELSEEVIDLPLFEAGTMYKGMRLGKHYSLKELGLWNQ